MKASIVGAAAALLSLGTVNAADPSATARIVPSGQGFTAYRQGESPVRVTTSGGSDTMRVSGGGTATARPADKEAAAWAAAAFPGEKLRLKPRPGGGWQLFSQGGETGAIVPSAAGYSIFFAGQSRTVMRSACGWTVYRAR